MAKVYSLNAYKPKVSKLSRNNKRLIFYILLLVLPLAQFAIFYVYVNINSIIMGFSTYVEGEAGYVQQFGWTQFVNNFTTVFKTLGERSYIITNSLMIFAFETCLGLPLALIFSYYMYKKRPLHKAFRVTLFLPQIISGIVFSSIFLYVCSAIGVAAGNPDINPFGPAATVEATRTTLIIFSVCMSFGVNVLLFSGAMSNINPSLVEASELDGCNSLQEFIHVTLPCIFPTVITFIVLGLAGIFTNQMFLQNFNIANHSLDTFGYFLYWQARSSDFIVYETGHLNYPELSCMSLLITAILFPLTLGVKRLLEKYGPSTR